MRTVLFAIVLAACCGFAPPSHGGHSTPVGTAAAAVQRGRYLTLAANCASCHTVAGGPLFAGGVAFVTPFGTLYSSNITPDARAGIGAWTEPQFRAALHAGVRPNGEHLYPAFPYTAFTKMTDADVGAVYAYLKSIPASSNVVPANRLAFPFSQRWLMGVWKALFLDEGPLAQAAQQTPQWNRGAYLVEALAHCSACHTPRNFMGAERPALRMTGGLINDEVASGDVRAWSAPNLTGAMRGLGTWSVDELARYLKTGRNSFVTTFGPMNEVIVNSTRHLSEDDIRAMSVYLKTLPANEGGAAGRTAEPPRLGGILYGVYCGTCHLPTGLGSAESAPRLAGSSLVVQAGDPASLINVILYGPPLPNPPVPGNHWKPMVAFGDRLADEEVAAVASYVRSAWGNRAAAVNATQVARQRPAP